MRFGVVARGKRLLYGIASMNECKPGWRRPFCNSKPTAINNSNSNDDCSSSSTSTFSSLSTYDEQYKALDKLDFMKASKILFTEPPKKKKFGLDFHLVQFFFACLPSLAVYLVAQYARSEMRKMDAELEKKKQAEFEAQAKEMERKVIEEKTAVASNPALLEVKERLERLELAVKEMVGESKKHPSDAIRTKPEDGTGSKQVNQIQQGSSRNESLDNSSLERGKSSTDGKPSGPATVNQKEGNLQGAKK